ncbi:MAG: CAAX prenyl protease-related protein [Isosphaerales bacterium]
MSPNPESARTDRGAMPRMDPAEQPRAGSAPDEQSPAASADILPYLVPMFAYVGLSGIESYLPRVDGGPSPAWYPLFYTVKLVIVMLLVWWYRSTWRDFRPAPTYRSLGLAVVIGLLVWALWIGLDGLYPMFPFLGGRVGFHADRLAPVARWAFIIVRMLGLALIVPLMEELFWRSFLMRWLIDQDFFRVPIGRVTPMAAATTAVLFALVHPEWLPALLTGLLWAGLLWRTRSLGACFVSHATANLALGIYVIVTGDWKFW